MGCADCSGPPFISSSADGRTGQRPKPFSPNTCAKAPCGIEMPKKQQQQQPSRKPRAAAGPVRAPRGAKARAMVTMPKQVREKYTNSDQLRHFWDASQHQDAPPLRTTYGNFTTIHSVVRFRMVTSTTSRVFVLFRWSADNCMALTWNAPSGSASHAVTKIVNPLFTSSPPVAMRPLRASLNITNLTAPVNQSGAVYCANIDNGLAMSTASVSAPGDNVVFDAGTVSSLADMVISGVDTVEIPQPQLSQGITLVSVPSSYPHYNSYNDYQSLGAGVTGNLRADEFNALFCGNNTIISGPTILQTFSQTGEDALERVPAMRTLLVMFEPTALANDYLLEFHRQDGARYLANTLGHSFARSHDPCPPEHETAVMTSAQRLASTPGFSLTSVLGSITSTLGSVAGAGMAFNSARLAAMRVAATVAPMLRGIGSVAKYAAMI